MRIFFRWKAITDGDEGDLAELDAATSPVRDLLGASRELVGRLAQVMGTGTNDIAAIGVLEPVRADGVGRRSPTGSESAWPNSRDHVAGTASNLDESELSVSELLPVDGVEFELLRHFATTPADNVGRSRRILRVNPWW